MASPAARWSSWARDWIQATSETQTSALGLLTHCATVRTHHFFPFKGWINFCCYAYTTFCLSVYLLVDTSCFYLLYILISAAMNMGMHILRPFQFFLIILRRELLDHMVILFLVLGGAEFHTIFHNDCTVLFVIFLCF